MRREKRLTKREKKAQDGVSGGGGGGGGHHEHIHCVACGRHIDHDEFAASPPLAMFIRCEHGSQFPTCSGCQNRSRELVAEHDRTGKPVNQASAWH